MSTAPIRILLADDQALFREGIRTLLSMRTDMKVVGEAANSQETLSMAFRLHPHVILLDLVMPVSDWVHTIRTVHQQFPDISVIILTSFDDDQHVFEGLSAGAIGYLLKDSPLERLVEAIHATAHGQAFLQASVATRVVAEFTRIRQPVDHPPGASAIVENLSGRELDVLRLVGSGHSNREIATALFIAEGTVKNHLTHILGKMGVRDRTQAALKARELKLI